MIRHLTCERGFSGSFRPLPAGLLVKIFSLAPAEGGLSESAARPPCVRRRKAAVTEPEARVQRAESAPTRPEKISNPDASWPRFATSYGKGLRPKLAMHARAKASGYSRRLSLVLQSHCWQSFVSAQDDPLACANASQPRIPVAKQTAIGEHNC